MNWYLDVLRNYAGFSGRARRKEYWMFMLFNFLISLGILVVEALLGSPGVLYGLYSLAVLIPTIAVAVRRLHDTDRSGWWLLLCFVPLGGLVIIVFVILEGTAGENRFGENPLIESTL